jgi:hypothetical protein
MKYVTVARLAPGVESVRQAFEVFGKIGQAEGTQQLFACADGKTFIVISESDELDMVNAASLAPFFETTTIMPVVDVDDAWVEAMTKAIANQG